VNVYSIRVQGADGVNVEVQVTRELLTDDRAMGPVLDMLDARAESPVVHADLPSLQVDFPSASGTPWTPEPRGSSGENWEHIE
jgi:hypothetical protein